MRDDASRRPEEILAEIERTRTDIDDTLHAIERRLTPGQLVDQGLDYLRQSGAREFASNLGHSVRDNPLPVALVGIGLAWLMVAQRRGGGYPPDEHATMTTADPLASSRGDGTGVGIADAARSAKERVGETVDRAREAVRSTRDRVADTAEAARERAGYLRDSARHQVHRAKNGYDRMLREQPLAVGAVGLAVGAVLAASLPRTREEDRMMGQARDRLADEATRIANEQAERARRAADAGLQAAEGAAREPQDDPSTDADRGRPEVPPAPPPASTGLH